jgi:hypothetical protein
VKSTGVCSSWRATFGRLAQVNATADPHQAGVRKSKPLKLCSLRLFVLMRISTGLPDGKWREVAEAARALEELGFDEAAAHEVRHDSFATLVPATLSTHNI